MDHLVRYVLFEAIWIVQIFILPIRTLGVAITPEVRMDTLARLGTQDILGVGAGLAPRTRLQARGLAIVRVRILLLGLPRQPLVGFHTNILIFQFFMRQVAKFVVVYFQIV